MAVDLAACVTSFLVAFIILPVIIKYSIRKNLVDVPGRRKIHKKITPSLGGIAIFISFLIASFIWMDFDQWNEVRYVLASLFIVFLLGVRDDLVPFRALHKLYGQIVAVIILSFSSVHINSLYGFLGWGELPPYAGPIITAFTVIVITNSFNLIDGLDGLAAGVGILALASFGLWFYLVNDHVYALYCFAMIGGILAFLVFNWEPSDIFMGDTGAMVIGMLLAILVIHFMNVNYDLSAAHPYKFTATIASAAAFIIVPLCDTLRIVILRLSKRQSPFRPDKSHIHHALIRLGLNHSTTVIILVSVNAIYILGAFLLRSVGDKYMIPAILLFAIVLSLILDRLIITKLSTKASSHD